MSSWENNIQTRKSLIRLLLSNMREVPSWTPNISGLNLVMSLLEGSPRHTNKCVGT